MACLLIDYENESGKVLSGISLIGLTRKDKIVIFYSKKAGKITMDFHKELEKVKAKKEYELVVTGYPSALDFQLSSYLGMCIHENPNEDYYIVSKDTGFECVSRFWNSRGVSVKCINCPADYVNAQSVL